MGREKEHNVYMVIADAVAITHFLVVNALFVVGEVTKVFDWMRVPNPGLEFVYRYVDAPVFFMLQILDIDYRTDYFTMIIFAEFVFLMSSMLYGIAVGVFAKFIALSLEV